jgi:hypothetical protein
MRFKDLTPGWFDYHSPYRDPPDPPDYYTVAVERVTANDGEELIVLRNQDGDEFITNAYEYDHRGEP